MTGLTDYITSLLVKTHAHQYTVRSTHTWVNGIMAKRDRAAVSQRRDSPVRPQTQADMQQANTEDWDGTFVPPLTDRDTASSGSS